MSRIGQILRRPLEGLRGAQQGNHLQSTLKAAQGPILSHSEAHTACSVETLLRIEQICDEKDARVKALEAEIRALRTDRFNDTLAWLCEGENLALMKDLRPDLVDRLARVLEYATPIPPSVYPKERR